MDALTTELRVGDLQTHVQLEWRSDRLLHEILYAHIKFIRANASIRDTYVPASKSSFSLPLILVARTTSPVPMVPYFPFRRTSARAVRGLWPFSSRSRPWCFLATSRGPTGTSSSDLEVSAFGLLEAAALEGIVVASERCGSRTRLRVKGRAGYMARYGRAHQNAC